MFAIETEELHKSLDGIPVLRGLTLRVPEGMVYGLLGPAGSGKSTLIHLLLGFLRKDRGLLRVLGSADIERGRRRMGYLPQSQRYHLRFTAREYLRFLGQCGGLAGAALDQRIAEELRAVDLLGAADQPLSTFSRGMLQRLGLAQALLRRPALLLLDEPVAGLDAGAQREMFDLIAGLRERGIAIVLATQFLVEAEHLCDRVGVLVAGRIAAESDVEALRAPGRNALISVGALPPHLAQRLQQLSPAVRCEGSEIALQPNSPQLQAQVLSALISAGVPIIALEPFGRPLEELYARAVRGEPISQEPIGQEPAQAATERAGVGDTLLRELLRNEDIRKE